MAPRLRSASGHARQAALATLAALLIFWGAAAPISPLPGTRGPAALGPFSIGPAAVQASISAPYASEGRSPVAPGVQHDWGTLQTTRSGRQAVHLLEVDIGTPEITLEAAIAGDRITARERTSSMAQRRSRESHRAVAAINGDVWAGYDSTTQYAPNGIHIQAGELVTAARLARPTFGIDSAGQPRIGNVLVSAVLTWPDGSIRYIDRVNQGRTDLEFVLYTPRFGPDTPRDVGGTDVVLAGMTLPLAPVGTHQAVVQEVRPAAGGIPIAAGTVVLNGPAGTLLDTLAPGTILPIAFSITPGWENTREAVGGREFIIRDGQEYISPRPSIANQLHPRTALGITAAGDLVMATVDGRQSGYSTGVDLEELAELMLARGAVQALNMDGGGSTTMAVRLPGDPEVSVANRPSDGSERAVANALIVVSSAPTGPLAIVNVLPNRADLWQGETQTFAAKGQDAAYNAVSLGDIAWSVQGAGSINGGGRYSASAAGDATVVATARGVQGTAAVTVRADTYPPVIKAPSSAIVADAALVGTAVPFRVSWAAATDKGRGVAAYELERAVAGQWVPVPLAKPTDLAITLTAAPAQLHRFRVRAVDRAGNASAWAAGAAFRLGSVQESSKAVVRKGRWTARLSPSFLGGRAISAQNEGTSARIEFTGQQIAWVSAVGPNRGEARVYVDGKLAKTVDLRNEATEVRRVVFTKAWSSSGSHALEVRIVGTSGRPRVDVDAFLSTAPAK